MTPIMTSAPAMIERKNGFAQLPHSLVAISSFAPSDGYFVQLKRLQELSQLRHGWDGANASPIPGKVIENSLTLLKSIKAFPLFIAPIADGAIQFDIKKNEQILEVEVWEDHFAWIDHTYAEGESSDVEVVAQQIKLWASDIK